MGFSKPIAPLLLQPVRVEEEEDEKSDPPADISWSRTCEVKVGGERKKKRKGGGKQKKGQKKKKREKLGSVRLQRRKHLFVCVRP